MIFILINYLLFWIADIFLGIKDYEHAIDCLKNCIKIDPNEEKYLYIISNAFFNINNYEESMAYANKLIDLDPRNAKAYCLKGK